MTVKIHGTQRYLCEIDEWRSLQVMGEMTDDPGVNVQQRGRNSANYGMKIPQLS